MEFEPVRALITREDDGDPRHEELHDVPGLIPGQPRVGVPLRLFLETGKIMDTSPVQHVARRGSQMIVDTANSRYRLTIQ